MQVVSERQHTQSFAKRRTSISDVARAETKILLLTIACGVQCYRSLSQAKEKAMNDCGTSNHTAEHLERTSSEASRKGCSELSQAFAGVCEQGWKALRTVHSTHSIPLQ